MNPDPNQKTRVRKLNRLADFRSRSALLFLLPFCFNAGAFMSAHAAQPPAPLTLSSNRYLFIVETSASMQPRGSGTLQMLVQLLMSGLNGNLRRGDTLGVWTFNEQLYAGRFPLQVWSPERRQTIAQRVTEFLRKQPLEKAPDLNLAMAEMLRVIKNSDNITVILFSDGSGQMRGTPFDDQINAVYWEQFLKMQKAGMPFVTVLRAHGGVIASHSVNFAPWPVDIPIIPTLDEAAQGAAAQPTSTNPPPTSFSVATNSPALPVLEKKVESAAEASAVKPEVPPVAVNKPLAPAPTVIAETPKKEPTDLIAAPPPVVAPTVDKTETSATTIPQAETKSVGEPAEPKPKAPITEPTPVAAAAAEAQINSPPESSLPPVQTAVAVPPESFFSGKGLLIAAIALLFAAVGLIALLVRRSRPPERISLITRSMDRDK